jgi:hypothetical protein
MCYYPQAPAHGHHHHVQYGRDVWQFLDYALVPHHRGGVMLLWLAIPWGQMIKQGGTFDHFAVIDQVVIRMNVRPARRMDMSSF